MILKKDKNDFKKGELVVVSDPNVTKVPLVCVVIESSIPCHYKIKDYHIVYSICKKKEFTTNRRFMKRMS